jgi:CRISPR-associated protein Cmr1
MEPLIIQLETLTPLWTGGVDGQCDRLHETGLIGSLRWWYEALVRGLGGQACDPTAHSCIYDEKKPHNGLCDACQVFGATGWRRQFRLLIEDTTQPNGLTGRQQPTGNRYKRRNNPTDRPQLPSWYFNGRGRGGTFKLTVIPLSPDFDPQLVLGLLKLMEKNTGLGEKTQLGYGWVQLASSPEFDINAFVNALQSAANTQLSSNSPLPQLCEMFFAQVEVKDPNLKATLNLKYDVRAAFRSAFGGNQQLRHFVCGLVRGQERQAAKIHYSQAVNDIMRVWGWIPGEMPISNVTRSVVVQEIYKTVAGFGRLQSWREFDSPRDTTIAHQTDKVAFLTSLLEL